MRCSHCFTVYAELPLRLCAFRLPQRSIFAIFSELEFWHASHDRNHKRCALTWILDLRIIHAQPAIKRGPSKITTTHIHILINFERGSRNNSAGGPMRSWDLPLFADFRLEPDESRLPFSAEQLTQIRMPSRHGGLGIVITAYIANAAFVGSVLAAWAPAVHSLPLIAREALTEEACFGPLPWWRRCARLSVPSWPPPRRPSWDESSQSLGSGWRPATTSQRMVKDVVGASGVTEPVAMVAAAVVTMDVLAGGAALAMAARAAVRTAMRAAIPGAVADQVAAMGVAMTAASMQAVAAVHAAGITLAAAAVGVAVVV
ncbi:unnamed protein product, partial [Phaeothamnion confervicola]